MSLQFGCAETIRSTIATDTRFNEQLEDMTYLSGEMAAGIVSIAATTRIKQDLRMLEVVVGTVYVRNYRKMA